MAWWVVPSLRPGSELAKPWAAEAERANLPTWSLGRPRISYVNPQIFSLFQHFGQHGSNSYLLYSPKSKTWGYLWIHAFCWLSSYSEGSAILGLGQLQSCFPLSPDRTQSPPQLFDIKNISSADSHSIIRDDLQKNGSRVAVAVDFIYLWVNLLFLNWGELCLYHFLTFHIKCLLQKWWSKRSWMSDFLFLQFR